MHSATRGVLSVVLGALTHIKPYVEQGGHLAAAYAADTSSTEMTVFHIIVKVERGVRVPKHDSVQYTRQVAPYRVGRRLRHLRQGRPPR